MVIETRPMADAAHQSSIEVELSRLLADSSATYNKTLHHHEMTSRAARAAVTVAEEQGDVATADLATERVEAHQKALWMLRSITQDA